MKKPTILLSIVIIFLLGACSNPSSTTDEKEEKAPEAEEEAASEENPKKKDKEEPDQPFEALSPSKDTRPLKERVSEEARKHMPAAEAYGEDRTRMVPICQTLMKEAEDHTDGPLKNHRLVAYYGHPNSKNMGILGEMEPDALMKKLKEQTQAYSDADPSPPVQPSRPLN